MIKTNASEAIVARGRLMVTEPASLALFALVWAAACILSGALVTDVLLRRQHGGE